MFVIPTASGVLTLKDRLNASRNANPVMNPMPSSHWVLVLTLTNAVPIRLTVLDRGSTTLAL